jgi:hypothetical protein
VALKGCFNDPFEMNGGLRIGISDGSRRPGEGFRDNIRGFGAWHAPFRGGVMGDTVVLTERTVKRTAIKTYGKDTAAGLKVVERFFFDGVDRNC